MGFKRRIVPGARKQGRYEIICRYYGRYELVDAARELPEGARTVDIRELKRGTRIALGRRRTLIVHETKNPTVETFARDAVFAYGSIRKASKALGVPFTTLRDWVMLGRGSGRRDEDDEDR